MLRVTSGTVRGFKLDVPDSKAVRPPLEMVRQAVFNILGQDLEGMSVLDIFAGSAIMGIEALSRGADFVLFVEKDRLALTCINKNLEKTRFLDRAKVMSVDAFHPRRYLHGDTTFDLVFLDPPFSLFRSKDTRDRLNSLIDEILLSQALYPESDLVLRMPRQVPLEPLPSAALLTDERIYGHSRVIFLQRRREPD